MDTAMMAKERGTAMAFAGRAVSDIKWKYPIVNGSDPNHAAVETASSRGKPLRAPRIIHALGRREAAQARKDPGETARRRGKPRGPAEHDGRNDAKRKLKSRIEKLIGVSEQNEKSRGTQIVDKDWPAVGHKACQHDRRHHSGAHTGSFPTSHEHIEEKHWDDPPGFRP